MFSLFKTSGLVPGLALFGAALVVIGASVCGGPELTQARIAPASEALADDGPAVSLNEGPPGVIGASCDTAADCGAEGAVCAKDGFPRGTCTLPCDGLCPDDRGRPPTFCAATSQLAEAPDEVGEGMCLAGCDYGTFPEQGCRDGYGCVALERAGQPGTVRYTCMPGAQTPVDGCLAALDERDVSFEPMLPVDDSPDDAPWLQCRIDDAVGLRSPVGEVALALPDGRASPRVVVSCEMALALESLAGDLAHLGVSKLLHLGTYACRTVDGTEVLSRHARGNAIDIWGFELADGTVVSVEDHLAKRAAARTGDGAMFREIVDEIESSGRWKVVLTPKSNQAHRDHLHLAIDSEGPGADAFLRRWPKVIGASSPR